MEENGIDAKSVDYARLSAIAIAGIKELNAKVDSLAGTVENAVVKVKELVADSIKERVVRVEYMEYVDRATGEILHLDRKRRLCKGEG